jgi:hypothetical protein
MKLLELFKGTGSVGKVAKKLGFSIVSVDLEKKFKPDININILDWDYKKYHKDTGYIPDFIWASPPCNTYSPLAYPLKERNTQTGEPCSERAKLGTKILYKTLEIIDYFLGLNPSLKYCIENPRGMMRKDKYMKQLYRETTLYCLYGDTKYKQTDFFSNFVMNLKEPKFKQCDETKMKETQLLKLEDKYRMPPKLIKQILTSYIKTL